MHIQEIINRKFKVYATEFHRIIPRYDLIIGKILTELLKLLNISQFCTMLFLDYSIFLLNGNV